MGSDPERQWQCLDSALLCVLQTLNPHHLPGLGPAALLSARESAVLCSSPALREQPHFGPLNNPSGVSAAGSCIVC